MRRRPTIVDVARRAGVSKSTVSLVLRQSPLVREDTRRAVRAAMEALGYVYNRAAAGLRGSGAGLVGLVINDLRNPFFTEFATTVQMALAARGYATVVANTDEDPGLQAQVVGSMIEHGVAALVISPTYGEPEATFAPAARADLPVLQVLRRVGPPDVPFASLDYARGGRLATEHLLDLGARRIAFVGGREGWPITEERRAGYRAVLRERSMEPILLPGPSTRAFGREAAGLLARHHPEADAAIAFNDLVALGLLAGLPATGRRAGGGGLRLVGFDDIEEARLSVPPLSSVRCDVAGLGRWTAGALLAWLEEGTRPPPETRLPVSLVARESSLS